MEVYQNHVAIIIYKQDVVIQFETTTIEIFVNTCTVFTTRPTKTYYAFKSDTHFIYSTVMYYPLTKGKSVTTGQDFVKHTGLLKNSHTLKNDVLF